MEPITIWRRDGDGRLIERPDDGTGGVLPDGAWTKLRALPRADFDALVKERDQARRQRDGMNEQYEAAMDVIHRNAGARRDGLCCILAWIDEAKDATARAERAERERDEARALLRAAADSVDRDRPDADVWLTDAARERLTSRIDAALRGAT